MPVTKIFETYKPKDRFLMNKSVEGLTNPEEDNATQT